MDIQAEKIELAKLLLSTDNPRIVQAVKLIFKKKNVVGFDIVELCPNPQEKSSDFLAAKLYYKMLAYKFKYENYKKEDEDD